MSVQSEILKKERERKNDLNIIHLAIDGSFYRAYNWSAFLLIKNLEAQTSALDSDGDPLVLKPTKKKDENGEYIFVGFPPKSMVKFIPNAKDFSPIENTIVDIPLPTLSAEDIEKLKSGYSAWAAGIPLTEKKPKKDPVVNAPRAIGSPKILDIVSRIISYPLEDKTPNQNTEFVRQLKYDIIGLF